MRVKPTRQPGKEPGDYEDFEPHAKRVDALALRQCDAAAQAADRPSLARVQQVRAEQHGPAEQRPDQIVAGDGTVERQRPQRDRRDARYAVVQPDRLDVAEEKVDRDAPGNGAERQEMAAEPQRH